MVHAAFEVFLGALFPGQNVRVPSVKMCELWRWAMYDLSRFVVLKCMEKAKRCHGVTDESRKGGASLLASGLKGEFERNGETVKTPDRRACYEKKSAVLPTTTLCQTRKKK